MGNVPIALAHGAVRYGRAVGCPVVVDIRDLWPDIYADLLPRSLGFLKGPALRALHGVAFRLKQTVREATAITALTQPYLDWALKLANRGQHGGDAVFAMCYPRRDQVPPQGDIDALRARLGVASGDQLAVYLGNIGGQSDFDTVVVAGARP